MKRNILLPLVLTIASISMAQKPRPDAFPPIEEPAPKVVNMATTLEEMYNWNRYPTYPVYVEMMQHLADTYPTLCHLDTIGTSVRGRLILCLAITGSNPQHQNRPEFFYTSTMHGDEVTGYYLMLRLCDSLLSSYGTSPEVTHLLDHTHIYINPLSNPDGTYRSGDHTVQGAIRYNANYVDLNRNYPDPFGTPALNDLQIENQYMIDYVQQHNFQLSANLHGGSEVMNYPWDSYTSRQNPNEHAQWWEEVGKRFVDTCRLYDNQRFRDVNSRGVIEGGDWYVISNGRQDYFNYYHGIREITMELSSAKTVSSDMLDHYWQCESHALINYIKEIFTFADTTDVTDTTDTNTTDTTTIDTTVLGIHPYATTGYSIYPNPTTGRATVVTPSGIRTIDLFDRPSGVHIIHVDGHPFKVIKL